jgi:signal transduction histidine kinase
MRARAENSTSAKINVGTAAARDEQIRALVAVEIAERLMTRGHDERIERVIGHLVQNALDATEGNKESGKVWIKLLRHGGQAVIEVGDTGIGMDATFLRDRLFKPFQTTKPAGMGIGAYESQQYVHELGGKMAVESSAGEGTRITVRLPLFEAGTSSLRGDPQPEAA